jgi:cytochrome c553
MISKFKKIAILSVLAISIIISCKKEKTTIPTTSDCTGVTPTYTADIKSIMDNNCTISGCHNSTTKADGKDYSNYNSVKSSSSSNSFMGSMQHLNGYKAMPKGSGKLSDEQLKTISCWIQNGTPQ